MKFLCIACDEAMKLQGTRGPEDGSLAVIYECPSCGWETAMLTNAMETQMVRSLGVKIGGRTVPAEPMEMARSSLAQHHAAHPATTAPTGETTGEAAGSKCPFSGVVADAFANNAEAAKQIVWTPEAEERFARIPSFAQPMVRKGIEMHALEHGHSEINEAVMEEAKNRFDS